jgi:hypothetical protein
MKVGYMMLMAIMMMVFLTGCYNRFEEYEPYSTFDERMASASKGKPMPTDDQMPPGVTDDSYASGGYYSFNNEFRDEGGAVSASEPRSVPAQRYSDGTPTGRSQEDLEVPFSSSHGQSTKHPVNIGAL